jgi:hypothetical protein
MCSDCFEIDYRKRRSRIYCKKCGGNLEEIDDNFIINRQETHLLAA